MGIISNPFESHFLDRKETPVISRTRNAGVFQSRSNVYPKNRRHRNQMLHRHMMNDIRLSWLSLSSAELNSWYLFADTFSTLNKYGDSIFMPAWSWYTRYNMTLLSTGLPLTAIAPVDTTPSWNPFFIVLKPNTSLGWFFNMDTSIPNGFGVLCQRKINLPPKINKIPKPLSSYRSYRNPDIEPFRLATIDEVPVVNRTFFCGLRACDNFGRTNGWQFFKEISE